MTDWTLVRAYTRHTDQVWAIEYLEDGDTMVSASFDETLHFWKISSGETVRVIRNNEPITCLKKVNFIIIDAK